MRNIQAPPVPSDGPNQYVLGRIAQCRVVISCLWTGGYSTQSVAGAATRMWQTFRNIEFGLLVGIGGGVPSPDHDIRLGDVVVGRPLGGHGDVIQYDLGSAAPDGAPRITTPRVHYGLIGFANQVIKDGKSREKLSREYGVLCVYMEAAGLMDDIPCIVRYAAATAAAYAKELLQFVHSDALAIDEGVDRDNFSTSSATLVTQRMS
ncbi:nucleoside phosphorylase domain-containing protein [Aspergillus falconensis]